MTGRFLLALLALLLLPPLAAAQEAVPPVPAMGGQIGIAAVVNDDIVSTLDVQDRMQLVLGTTGLPNTQEMRARLLPQVMQLLVTESLQRQEARRLGLEVSAAELDNAMFLLGRQQGIPPERVYDVFRARGIPVESLLAQIKSELLWNKIMGKEVRRKVRITDDEVKRAASDRRLNRGRDEVVISLLSLPVRGGAGEDAAKKALAEDLHAATQKQGNESFEALARQIGGAEGQATSAVSVAVGDLDPLLARVVDRLAPGEVSEPFRTPEGYQLVQLLERRQGSAATLDPSELVLKRILFAMDDASAPREVQAMMEVAQMVSENPGSCTDASVAGFDDLQAADIQVNFVRTVLGRLPEPLQPMVAHLGVGQVSDPFATPRGIELLMVCERIRKPQVETVDEGVRDRLFEEKLKLEATKYLRNLRRNAFIEIRI